MFARTEFIITNVTGPHRQYVGHYVGWHDIPNSVPGAYATAASYLVELRWEYPTDKFELTEETRTVTHRYGS